MSTTKNLKGGGGTTIRVLRPHASQYPFSLGKQGQYVGGSQHLGGGNDPQLGKKMRLLRIAALDESGRKYGRNQNQRNLKKNWLVQTNTPKEKFIEIYQKKINGEGYYNLEMWESWFSITSRPIFICHNNCISEDNAN